VRKLVLVALVGLVAQLVDGSLGMGFGVTSSTLLVAGGLGPAAASAAIHVAEIGTSLVSGASHHALGNTDWRTVSILAVPGFVGAFVGATLLAGLAPDQAVPVVAAVLLVLGTYVTLRFLSVPGRLRFQDRPSKRFLVPVGLVAGTLDALGGGGWAPSAPRRSSPPGGSSRARRSARSTAPSSWWPWAPRWASCSPWAVEASTGRSWPPCWSEVPWRPRSRPRWRATCRPGSWGWLPEA
jgi:hypothetical protein